MFAVLKYIYSSFQFKPYLNTYYEIKKFVYSSLSLLFNVSVIQKKASPLLLKCYWYSREDLSILVIPKKTSLCY